MHGTVEDLPVYQDRDRPGAYRTYKTDDAAFDYVRHSYVVVGGADELHDLDLARTGVDRDPYHVGDNEECDQEQYGKSGHGRDVYDLARICQEVHDIALLVDLADSGVCRDLLDHQIGVLRLIYLDIECIRQIVVVIEVIQDRARLAEVILEVVVVALRCPCLALDNGRIAREHLLGRGKIRFGYPEFHIDLYRGLFLELCHNMSGISREYEESAHYYEHQKDRCYRGNGNERMSYDTLESFFDRIEKSTDTH